MRDSNSLLKTSLKLHRTECHAPVFTKITRTECHGSGRGITADLFSLKLRYCIYE